MKKDLLALVLLSALVAAAYSNSLSIPFVYDDHVYIVQNTFIRDPANLGKLFSRDYFPGTAKPRYRPVSAALYIAGYQVWGLNPFGHHLTKLLLHLGNAILVYLFFRLLIGGRLVPLGGAVFFALHPVNTEAVNCIAFNDDLLAAGFLLLALIGVRKYDLTPRRGYYYLSCGAYLLALFSKETALVFIPLLLLTRYSFPGPATSKTASGRTWPGWLAITAGYGIVRFLILPGEKMLAATPPEWSGRLLLAGRVILQYLRLLLLPVKLTLDYSLPLPLLPFTMPLWPAALICLAPAIAAIGWARSSRSFFWGFAWLVLTILPLCHFLELPTVLAERYLYLPSIGWAFLLMMVLEEAWPPGRSGRRVAALVLSVLIVLSFFSLTRARNRDWREEEKLWLKAVSVSPAGAQARNNLGWLYFQRGDYPAAEREYNAALRLDPPPRVSAVVYTNLALISQARGDDQEALRSLRKARLAKPDHIPAYRREGYIHLRGRRYRRAGEVFLKIIELKPDDYQTYDLLGQLMAELGRRREAEECFLRAIELNPDYESARKNLEQLKRFGEI